MATHDMMTLMVELREDALLKDVSELCDAAACQPLAELITPEQRTKLEAELAVLPEERLSDLSQGFSLQFRGTFQALWVEDARMLVATLGAAKWLVVSTTFAEPRIAYQRAFFYLKPSVWVAMMSAAKRSPLRRRQLTTDERRAVGLWRVGGISEQELPGAREGLERLFEMIRKWIDENDYTHRPGQSTDPTSPPVSGERKQFSASKRRAPPDAFDEIIRVLERPASASEIRKYFA